MKVVNSGMTARVVIIGSPCRLFSYYPDNAAVLHKDISAVVVQAVFDTLFQQENARILVAQPILNRAHETTY